MNDIIPGKLKNHVLAYKKESITVKVRVEKATWKQIVHLLSQGKQKSENRVKECKNFPTTYSMHILPCNYLFAFPDAMIYLC